MDYYLSAANAYNQPFVDPAELVTPIPHPPLLFYVPPYYFLEREERRIPKCYDQPVPDSITVPGLWTPEVLAIWPEPWTNYKNLGELCGEFDNFKDIKSIHHNYVESIVCRCPKSKPKFSLGLSTQGNPMKCHAHDPYIPPGSEAGDTHRFIEVVKNLEWYCRHKCECVYNDDDDEEKTGKKVRLREGETTDGPDPKRLNNGGSGNFWEFGSYSEKDRSDDTQYLDDWNYPGSDGFQCPLESTCSSFADCRKVRKYRGCEKSTCQVKDTSRDKNFALGLCKNLVSTVSAGLGGRKRRRKRNNNMNEEEAFSCACNRTYVSHACCSSDTGLVWEHPDLQLGQLVLEDNGDDKAEKSDGET